MGLSAGTLIELSGNFTICELEYFGLISNIDKIENIIRFLVKSFEGL